jgi:two-component system CheB/CheR fusion protein
MPRLAAGSRRALRRPPRDRRAVVADKAAPHDGAADNQAAYDPAQSSSLPFLTVAIGASAGGLRAFTEFLEQLPPDTGMAFVLIQHLDPSHKSLLVGLLAPHSQMTVVEATDGMKLLPNRVFVIPPDSTMTVDAGRLVIASPAPARANRWPIDSCFTSLARDQGNRAVCIVLSGAGSDGSRSLRAVRQHGGLVLAQAEDDGQGALVGMPASAVATGLVDHLLPVRAMPAKLIEYQRPLRAAAGDAVTVMSSAGRPPEAAAEGEAGTRDASQLDDAALAEICGLLRGRTGHDFSQYKTPTLERRIRRRMHAQRIATMAGLVQLLRREPRQLDRLFHDLLVGVTQFFRDPAAFDAVRKTVLPGILADKAAGDFVRVWVPGCASGEEVYSLAILIRELMDRQGTYPQPQIFGTDINDEAISAARTARYRKPALARLTPEQRARWFIADGEFYRPVREIREMCVFSVHSVFKDPPFSKLDLISCRNLLIYFDGKLQARVIRSFHYGLNPGGWLFLGPSEGVGHPPALFEQIDRRHRLFRRRDVEAFLPGLALPGQKLSDAAPSRPVYLANDLRPHSSIEDGLNRSARRALEQYSPAFVVIDRAADIVRFSGGVVGRYLEPSPGVANLGLLGMLRRPLRRPVRTAVHRAITLRETVVHEGLVLGFEAQPRLITLVVQPISDGRTDAERYLVAFIDAGVAGRRAASAPDVTGAAADDDQELARELAATRSQLLAAIADLETANEELRSFNEEYQSANEELQSTNEELETAKEEMQSINEELQTINTELSTRNEQLSRLNNDFQNLMDSTRIPTVFLDRELRITRFTPSITALFALRETDLGRRITDIAGRLHYTGMVEDVATVLEAVGRDPAGRDQAGRDQAGRDQAESKAPGRDQSGRDEAGPAEQASQAGRDEAGPVQAGRSGQAGQARRDEAGHVIEREVQLIEGDTTFLMRIQPYRTVDGVVEGVVITFVDISAGKRLQAEAERALRTLNVSLERRVVDRTADLQTIDRALAQQIEERRRAEEMLRQSQKMEAVGKLTGGIAHDFNNLLGVIIGNVEFLLDGVQDKPDLAELGQDILDSALSGAELTHRLLAFARKQPLQPQVIDLNALLPGHAAMLRRTLGDQIQIGTTLAPDLWPTLADPTQVGEALLNLALNARDAMPHGGRMSIQTANVHLDRRDVAANAELAEGDYVVLSVADTGTGMSPEVVERAMEPFYTTKPAGAGSGLGLSMAYGFAKQSEGDLRIESGPGVGTTIRLFLPRAPEEAAPGAAAPVAALPDPGGSETILLVDDNPTLRAVTQRHLAALGYRVRTATSGVVALAMLQAGERFDLVLTDLVMPDGMSGYGLAEAARALLPGLKLLFTTGYAGDLPIEGDAAHDRPPVLRKPYRRQELARAVRAMLDGGHGGLG